MAQYFEFGVVWGGWGGMVRRVWAGGEVTGSIL